MTTLNETTVSLLGLNLNLTKIKSDISVGDLNSAIQLINSTGRGLSALKELAELICANELLEQEMVLMLNKGEDLETRLESIAEKMENSLSGE